ncbi:GNAT family N-acetyltransferase [Inconstantimicrobium mannanitabidum]|uniref:N-acetyltransferase n=1 Tax=Inconstantimicrobium mannanitabidum TaxID=1604901 RepID=A0ACB5RF22_9CLOT|nr:GNAT family N-acetyltransferase [Clostridium sp. TW13]GKX67412.1 N-acetyltransferase [Clostridium sp. TW13]
MVIEKLKLEDVNELLDLYKELTPYENSIGKSTEIYKEILKDDKYLLLVAKDNDRIVGSALAICCMVLALDGGRFLVIEDVIVKDGLRGKGIGKELMKAIDEFAIKNNCVYSIVVSSGHRKGAHKFYESVGFTEDVKGFRKGY